MNLPILLRDIVPSDLPVFFEQKLDAGANRMAAFTSKDPGDREAFNNHWKNIIADDSVITRTIVFDGKVAGYVSKYRDEDRPEVTYWIGRDYWGRGIATAALKKFLQTVRERPLYARVAKDNAGSFRVLEKCGFRVSGEGSGYANARREITAEYIMSLENE